MAAEPPAKKARVRQKIVIDSDPGVDDVWALCLALASPEDLDILGVTIVGGGNTSDTMQMAANACAVLHLAGRDDIKVVRGASESLTGADRGPPGTIVHGNNGIGNVILPEHALSTKGLEHGHASAAHFLVDTCRLHPGEVTVVSLGPMTNLAEALRLSPSFARHVRRVVMMGGCVQGGQVGKFGNKSPTSEANIFNDPEAAKLCFSRFPDIVMAGLNVTCQLDCEVFRERARELGEAGRLLHAISQHYVGVLRARPDRPIPVHDSSAVLALLRPELFPETRRVCIDVETAGKLTKGMTVADWGGHWRREPQTTVLMRVDADAALEFFLERIALLKFPDLGPLPRLGEPPRPAWA